MENEEIKRDIGEILKAERARKGLSLEDVQSAIKINKRFIKAMEDNDFSGMPTSVAGKGFLKNYSTFLGLNVKQILAQYGEKHGIERPAQKITMSVPAQAPKSVFSVLSSREAVIGASILGVVLFFTLVFVGCSAIKRPRNFVKEAPSPVRPSVAANILTLEVSSVDRAWLEVIIDGTPFTSEVVFAGDKRSFTGSNFVRIKTGNAGGVRVTLNGKYLGPLGERNAVVEKQFTR